MVVLSCHFFIVLYFSTLIVVLNKLTCVLVGYLYCYWLDRLISEFFRLPLHPGIWLIHTIVCFLFSTFWLAFSNDFYFVSEVEFNYFITSTEVEEKVYASFKNRKIVYENSLLTHIHWRNEQKTQVETEQIWLYSSSMLGVSRTMCFALTTLSARR